MPARQDVHGPAGGGPRARRHRVRRARALLWGALAVPLAGAAWLGVTGALARADLLAAQRDLDALRDRPTAGAQDGGGLETAAGRLRSAAAHTARAHRYTTGPAWYLAARLPVLGDPVRTVRGAAWAADQVTARVLPPLVRAGGAMASAPRGDGLDLAPLGREVPALDAAARAAAHTRDRTGALPRHTWLPAADQARTRLAGLLDRLAPATADAASAARILPAMLGAHDERRYLVIFQNPAEARGTGGLPGAHAVLTASRGRLSFDGFGSDTAMTGAHAAVDLGPDYTALYGRNDPTGRWVNANLSPHFPYAARIWADAWQRRGGDRLDGVIALDPGAMAGLLAATGPATLADGTAVSAATLVDLTERTSYSAISDTGQRKDFFLSVARAAAGRLLTAAGTRDLPSLLFALRTQLGEGRVTVWSAHPGEQARLERMHVAGTVPAGPEPLAGLVVNNAAGSKLDYYLDRSLRWQPGACGPDGRDVTVTVTLANHAPLTGLPPYVTQRDDQPPYTTRPGDNRLMVSYFATGGAALTGATLDGRPALAAVGAERGHPVFTLDVELPAHSTRTLTLHLTEPVSDRPPVVLRQPLVRPLRYSAAAPARCGR